MFERIVTQPDNYEPFLLSQGIRFGNLLFISGQAGADDEGRIVDGGFRAQGEQAFANLRRALEAGGSSLKDVVKVTPMWWNCAAIISPSPTPPTRSPKSRRSMTPRR